MRLTDALLHAMRIRRNPPIGRHQADQWEDGDLPDPDHQGLAELLAAANAPATAEELAGEHEAVAAFAAAYRRAAAPTRRGRVRKSRTTRTVVVNIAAGAVLAASAGTAVAARTGNLPDGAQQHAHRLFSALGVPAPAPGTSPSDPAPAPGESPSDPASTRQPEPSVTNGRPSRTPTPGPSASSSPETVPVGWCHAWSANPRSREAPWWPDLVKAADGEQNIPAYCDALTHPGAPTADTKPTPAKPSGSKKPPGKPSTLPTPGRSGKPHGGGRVPPPSS